jgi:hypothetical protein
LGAGDEAPGAGQREEGKKRRRRRRRKVSLFVFFFDESFLSLFFSFFFSFRDRGELDRRHPCVQRRERVAAGEVLLSLLRERGDGLFLRRRWGEKKGRRRSNDRGGGA